MSPHHFLQVAVSLALAQALAEALAEALATLGLPEALATLGLPLMLLQMLHLNQKQVGLMKMMNLNQNSHFRRFRHAPPHPQQHHRKELWLGLDHAPQLPPWLEACAHAKGSSGHFQHQEYPNRHPWGCLATQRACAVSWA